MKAQTRYPAGDLTTKIITRHWGKRLFKWSWNGQRFEVYVKYRKFRYKALPSMKGRTYYGKCIEMVEVLNSDGWVVLRRVRRPFIGNGQYEA